MRSLIFPSTGSKATSSVMPAAVIRPAFCRTAALYQREFCPLYARTYSASSTTTDQIHVRVPYVLPSSRNGEMCRSSASAILRSSSFDHVIIDSPRPYLPSAHGVSAIDNECVTDYETSARAAKPKDRSGDLFRPTKSPDRLIFHDLFHSFWFTGQHA